MQKCLISNRSIEVGETRKLKITISYLKPYNFTNKLLLIKRNGNKKPYNWEQIICIK